MINFETENLIIVCYPNGAGGKFLINCLGLSDSAVFQDARIAQAQMDGNFNQLNKINCLKEQLQKITVKWNDLALGCIQLFAVNNEDYYHYSAEKIQLLDFNNTVVNVSTSGLKFFIVAHWPSQLDSYCKVWKNAKIIYFKNCKEFVRHRSIAIIQDRWNMVRGPNWPKQAPESFNEFDLLPAFVKQELENKFFVFKLELEHYIRNNDFKFVNHEELLTQYPKALVWNTNNYFSIDATVNEIKKIYSILNLNNFNEDLIREYYKLWINKLDEIKNK